MSRKACELHKPIFERLGYKLEIRQVGNIKIGLWRMKFVHHRVRVRHSRRLVWMAGFGDTPLSWQVVLRGLNRALKQQFDELVVLDLPGFNGYMGIEQCGSMDELTAGVIQVLDELEPRVVFGHSLGGWLTALYAAEKGSQKRIPGKYPGPDMVIIANPSGVFGNKRLKRQWIKRFEAAMAVGFTKFRKHIFANEPIWFPLIAWQFDHFFTRKDVLAFMKSVREDHVVESRLKHFHCKTWLLWGEADTLSPSVWVSYWLKALKDSKLPAQGFVIPKVGHSIHLESPVQTISLLSSILRQQEPTALSRRWWKEVTV